MKVILIVNDLLTRFPTLIKTEDNEHLIKTKNHQYEDHVIFELISKSICLKKFSKL